LIGQAEAVEFGLGAVDLLVGWVRATEEDPEGDVEAAGNVGEELVCGAV